MSLGLGRFKISDWFVFPSCANSVTPVVIASTARFAAARPNLLLLVRELDEAEGVQLPSELASFDQRLRRTALLCQC